MSAWDSIGCQRTLNLDGRVYTYFSLPDAEKNGLAGIARLPFSLMPFSLKVPLENLLRFEDGQSVTRTSRRVSA